MFFLTYLVSAQVLMMTSSLFTSAVKLRTSLQIKRFYLLYLLNLSRVANRRTCCLLLFI